MKGIIRKTILYSLSLLLVIMALYVKVDINIPNEKVIGEYKIRTILDKKYESQFKIIDVVSIDVSDNVLKANAETTIETVMRIIAFSVYVSIGAQHAWNLIETTAQGFVDWYENNTQTTNPTADGYIPYEGTFDYILDYLTNTGQLSQVNPDSYVIPEETLKAIYDTGEWYINHVIENPSNWVRFQQVTYKDHNGNYQSTTLPTINGQLQFTVVNHTTTNIIASREYAYVYNSMNYWLTNNDALTSVQKISVAPGIYRLKMQVRNRANETEIIFSKYSLDITEATMEILDTAVYFDIAFRPGKSFYLIPFFNDFTLIQNFAYAIPFQQDNITMTNGSYVTALASWNGIFMNSYSNTEYTTGEFPDFVDDTGYPIGIPDIGEDSDYWTVPVPDPNAPEPVYPTPVPPELNPIYEYTPPTTVPTTTEWTDLVTPVDTMPFPGVDDLLDGTFMKDLMAWLGGVATWLTNAIMNWFSMAFGSLFEMIQDLIDGQSVGGQFETPVDGELINDFGAWFNGFETDTFGLTSVITAPLNMINSLVNAQCTPIPLELIGYEFDLPCIDELVPSGFGSMLTLYRLITDVLIAYWVMVNTLALIKGFKDPEKDNIEVLEL